MRLVRYLLYFYCVSNGFGNDFYSLLLISDHVESKTLQTLSNLIFKRKIRMTLFNILESEDSYEDLESIILKVIKYLGRYQLCVLLS